MWKSLISYTTSVCGPALHGEHCLAAALPIAGAQSLNGSMTTALASIYLCCYGLVLCRVNCGNCCCCCCYCHRHFPWLPYGSFSSAADSAGPFFHLTDAIVLCRRYYGYCVPAMPMRGVRRSFVDLMSCHVHCDHDSHSDDCNLMNCC